MNSSMIQFPNSHRQVQPRHSSHKILFKNIKYHKIDPLLYSPEAKSKTQKRLKFSQINHIALSARQYDKGPTIQRSLMNVVTSQVKKDPIRFYSFASEKGIKSALNQDKVHAITKIPHASHTQFFAIYDGQGGPACSDFLFKQLHARLFQNKNFKSSPELALLEAFAQTEFQYFGLATSLQDRSGSCALVLLFVNNRCYVANAGSSRAILCKDQGRSIVNLTKDHRPHEQRERILRTGGDVYTPAIGLTRMLPGNLVISRSFGHVPAKNALPGCLIARPEISSFQVDRDCDFIIAASDGVLDVLESSDLVRIAMNVSQSEVGAGNVVAGEVVRKILESANARNSTDNISAMYIRFQINSLYV